MKTFIGVKLIKAAPMNLGEYNKYRGWAMPSNEDPEASGYFIEYIGTPPNDARHEGYISWSPKEQFDNAYLVLPDNVTGDGVVRFYNDVKEAIKMTLN